ncbi:gsk3 [Candida margitis]|uniref:gsk3 n=1 Tax=Candida margitis TaxID=1775924 RepID=UPI002227A5E4|nr:gsk3 [Candida margitis]KAI5954066.1 gsk3 [Candida margitis]
MHLSKGLNKLNLDSIAPDLNLPFPGSNNNQAHPSKPNKPKLPVVTNKAFFGGIGTDELDVTPPPSVLKSIDYDYLEKQFQIYKYYPVYVHNGDITTPELKDLIVDKPIYNEANKHVKRNKKKKSTSAKLKSKSIGNEEGRDPLRESRKLRKEQREERKELRKEQRDERRELKQMHKQQKSQQSHAPQMKKTYSGHYMNKVNSLSCANGGSNDVGATHGVNPYQMKTQFSNNTTNTTNGGEDYYWNKNQPMSRTNSQFSRGGNNGLGSNMVMKRIGSSSTSTSDDDPDCAELDPSMGKGGNGNGGYDSEKTEVDDEFNPIAFNNPFDFGKKLSAVGTTASEDGGIAPASSTMMSNSSSYNNYNGGVTKTHQNSLFSNPQYSHLYSSRTNSRNNSMVGYGNGNGSGPMTGLSDGHPVPAAVPQRRSSSVTLINNSQNSSQNRNNNTTAGNGGNNNTYGTHNISQPKRNNSIATKFMNMFRDNSQDSNNSSNGNYDNDYDDEIMENHDENTSMTMMRRGSTKSHKMGPTTSFNGAASQNISRSRRQSLFGNNQQAQLKEDGVGNNNDNHVKPKAGPLPNMEYPGGHPMTKSNSFDQTKSQRTTLKNKLKMKFTNESRRFSEQFGMYNNKGKQDTGNEVVTENVTNGHTGETQTIQYTQSQMVGHGSFGVVFQTQIMPSNEICAMKRVLQDKRFKNRELQIMKLVHHRNIADLKYYFYTNNDKNELYLNLILEFVPETLYKASHYYVSKRLSMPPLEIKLYTYQMFRALNYIHSQGICHRDIKPQNLLINPTTGELKLCDFGSAKILNPQEPNVSYICSRYYRAPELIFGATNYTTKIDVWSAGCVMAELILGQPLFPGESGIDQLVEIIKILGTPSKEQIKSMNPNYMEHRFPQIKPIPLHKIFKKMAPDCIQFLIKVLQYSPLERISCIEAMVDPYFDELRNESTKLPNYRKLFSQQFHHSTAGSLGGPTSHSNAAQYQLYDSQPDMKDLPELFDFDDRELSVAPQLNSHLIPAWAWSHLQLKSGPINNLQEFVPMTKEELKVTLE